MTALMHTPHARIRTFLAASTVLMLVLIGAAAMLVSRNVGSITRSDADARASHGVDLLVTIGASLPNLTPDAVAHGLSQAGTRDLDAAVRLGQSEGLIANFVIFARSGRIVYSSGFPTEGSTPRKEAELVAALAGHSPTRAHPHEVDASTGLATGTLDAFEPLLDKHGAVYGAMEVSLPLKPIEATAARIERHSLIYVTGGGILVWLLLMPLWVRLARAQAGTWTPRRRRTLRAFRRGLDRGEIELAYQPQIEPGSRRVDGVEALVRWRRAGVVLAPDQFLPAVETSTLMARLTDRVLDLALAQQSAWSCSGIAIRVSVNLSATDLADRSLPERIGAKLDLHDVAGENLTVEVTETAILEDVEHARSVLAAVDQMGIDIAVDDFGTGHASISRLHGLPVSEVKIDRSFVSDTRERSRTYLAAMVVFGRNLGLRVVAEGVEDTETLALLTSLDCDLAQGYLISRPLDSEAMTIWLRAAAALSSPIDVPPLAAGAALSANAPAS
jgi:EAL domain-containing protein (putative c-di-GMP-specific phosphodiesterase class I)